jgi:hypothetical protein
VVAAEILSAATFSRLAVVAGQGRGKLNKR